ncbi:hypothetical protein ACWEQC_33380, partial [Streptomyces shenzhenensis]
SRMSGSSVAGVEFYPVRDRPGRTLGLRESAVTAAGLPAKAPHPREHRAVVLEPAEAGNTAPAAPPARGRPLRRRTACPARAGGALRRPAFR